LKLIVAIIILLFLIPGFLYAGSDKPAKKAMAIRVNPVPPRIDGILDDEAWKKAPIFGDFLQHDPSEGAAATEKTEFKVIYDDEAVYFGVLCYDSDPEKIVSRLTRRDGRAEADWVSVNLDPHYDHQTGYWFTAHVSGSVSDGAIYNDGREDWTWDAVWEVKVQKHDLGWTAEYRIPYYVLRFSPKEEYTWGMNIDRSIYRKKELDQWMLIERDRPGRVSRFGILEGIRDIHPPSHLELIPYTMGRTVRSDENDYSGNIGADIRYGITSSISLNATINPDFGQVEADPSELNLTAFESYLTERRPFFVEGASIFKNIDYSLFYSRRIGRYPEYFAIPENAEEINRSQVTNIIAATKLTGKTTRKTTFGVLDAVTSPEYATIKRGDSKDKFLLEPLTNYFVARLNQDVLKGNSKFGFIATAVNRKDSLPAYMGAMDWDLWMLENSYEFSGTLAASHSGMSDERKSGYLAHFELDKRGRWLGGETGFSAISPGLDFNDLGFIRRDDVARGWGRIEVSQNNRFGIFRRGDYSISIDLASNYDGVVFDKGIDAWIWNELINYWWINLNFGRNFNTISDEDVRREGILIKNPASYFFGFDIHTDSRKRVAFRLSPFYWRKDDGRSYQQRLEFEIELRPLTNIQIYTEPAYTHRFSYAQWADRYEIDGVPHYVYGELDSKTLDFTTRANICFTPKLTLELYLQPFIAVGDYIRFKELSKPSSYQFKPYNLNENWDFYERALKGNMVLRWEFSPGSTMFVVWSQSRGLSLEDPAENDLRLRPFEQLASSFSDAGSNIFLIKINYWIGL